MFRDKVFFNPRLGPEVVTPQNLGKVVLITGASSGIGAQVALLFASLGCSLALVGRNASALRATAQACLAQGLTPEKVLLLNADLFSDEALEQVVAEAVQKLGKLDVLINSAGITSTGHIEDYPMHLFDSHFGLNLRSVYYLIRTALPHLAKTRGNVVNLSSGCASGPVPEDHVYCGTKASLNYLTQSLALEVAGSKVRLNGVSLTATATGMHQRSGLSAELIEREFDSENVPLGRIGTVDDVVQAIAFLADNRKSSFVTGEILSVTGGTDLYGDV